MPNKLPNWKKAGIIAVVIGAVVSISFSLFTGYMAGVFTTITPTGPKPLRVIEGFVGGTEDIAMLADGTGLFVSSGRFNDPGGSGAIYFVSLVEETAPVRLTEELPFEFQPHGIDLLETDEQKLLFVVNHRGGSGFGDHASGDGVTHTVEVFEVTEPLGLKHVRAHEDPALVSPNDVAALDKFRFYATNDHGYPSGLMKKAEDWLRLPAGNIVYYDGHRFHEVYDGTRYGNGLALSRDKKTLYAVETTAPALRRFAVDELGALTQVSVNADHVGLDNLFIDEDGAVWSAGHPKVLKMLEHSKDPARVRSPSKVVRFEPKPRGMWEVETFYMNRGNPISGASSVATNGEVVVVGAVYDPRLVVFPRRPL